jgi:MYXO-CTERM domain-containing protein
VSVLEAAPSGQAAGPRLRLAISLARAALIPLVVFVLVRWMLVSAAASVGFDAWHARSWARWDSNHYLAIATKGYEYFSCARIGGRAQDACGNAAWFPLYPWLLRPLIALGVTPLVAGVWVSGAGALGFLVALWNAFLMRRGIRGLLVLGMAALFPGAVYQHAIFPTSVALLCLVLASYAVSRGTWAPAGAFGALFSLTYVTGVLLAPVQALVAFIRTRALRPALLAGGIAALGFLAVLGLHQILLGHWDAFYWVHRKGFPAMARPLRTFLDIIGPAFDSNSDPRARTVAAQTLTVAGLVVLGLAMAFLRRRRPDPVRLWAVLTTLLFWATPLVVGRGVSLYRSDALVLPVLFLLLELPVWTLAPLLLWLVALGHTMAALFFTGYLV